MNIESKFVRILTSKHEGYFSIDLNEKDFLLQILSTNIYDRMTMKLDRMETRDDLFFNITSIRNSFKKITWQEFKSL
jgi:hypothetical protein